MAKQGESGKKNQANKNTAKPKKRKVAKKPKEMPGIIIQNITLEPKEKNPPNNKRSADANDQQGDLKILTIKPDNPKAKKLMWVSVATFTIVIALLWGWAIKIQFSNLNFIQSSESKLLQKTKQEWSNAFADEQKNQNTTTVKIKDGLKQIIATINATNTLDTLLSASSTTTTLTTTTTVTTDTKRTIEKILNNN